MIERYSGESDPKLTTKEQTIIGSKSAEGLIVLFLTKLRATYQERLVLSQAEVESASRILDPLKDRMRTLQQALSPELLEAEGKFDASKLAGAESLASEISQVGQNKRLAQDQSRAIQRTIDLNIQGLINGIAASFDTNGPTEIPPHIFDAVNFFNQPSTSLPDSSPDDQSEGKVLSDPVGLEAAPILGLLDGVITATTRPEQVTVLATPTKRRSARATESLPFDWKTILDKSSDLNNQQAIRNSVNLILKRHPEFYTELRQYKEITLKTLEKLAYMEENELVSILATSFKDTRSFISLSRILAIMHWARYSTPNDLPIPHQEFEKHAELFIAGETKKLFPQELIKLNPLPVQTSLPPRPDDFTTTSQAQIPTTTSSSTESEDIRADRFPTTHNRIVQEIVQALRAFSHKAKREQINLEWPKPLTAATLTRIDTRIKERDINTAVKKGFIHPIIEKGRNGHPLYTELDVAILEILNKYEGKMGINERDLTRALKIFKEAYEADITPKRHTLDLD